MAVIETDGFKDYNGAIPKAARNGREFEGREIRKTDYREIAIHDSR